MCAYSNEWTFLLYANGNNELEPETWQSVLEIQQSVPKKKTTVLMQISREKQDIVSLLRPNNQAHAEQWNGTRRYICEQSKSPSYYSLADINMADPNALYAFIDWGMTHFPAKRYMLSVSGHIYQFVGVCPDYSGDKPLMMGFPELSLAIQTVFDRQDSLLDVLVLDTCYASTVEILYELGRYEHPRIGHVLTYIGKGPLRGLPYANLLSLLETAADLPIHAILKILVAQLAVDHESYGMIALSINHQLLSLVWELFDKLALSYLLCKDVLGVEQTPEQVLAEYRPDYPWSLYLKPLHRLLGALVTAKRTAALEKGGALPIHVLSLKIPDTQRKKLYCRLSFAKGSHWSALLCGPAPEKEPDDCIESLAPLTIPRNILATFVYASNDHLSPTEQAEMIEALIRFKRWVWP